LRNSRYWWRFTSRVVRTDPNLRINRICVYFKCMSCTFEPYNSFLFKYSIAYDVHYKYIHFFFDVLLYNMAFIQSVPRVPYRVIRYIQQDRDKSLYLNEILWKKISKQLYFDKPNFEKLIWNNYRDAILLEHGV